MAQPTHRQDDLLTPDCESSFATQNIPALQTLADMNTASIPMNPDLESDCDCEHEDCDCDMEGCSEEVQYVRDPVTGKCICRSTGRIIITPCPGDFETGDTKGNHPTE